MQKSSGFLILLLIVAIVLSPPNPPGHGFESPLTAGGDSVTQSETLEDNGDDTAQTIAAVIFIIIVIFIIYRITGSDNQSHERR